MIPSLESHKGYQEGPSVIYILSDCQRPHLQILLEYVFFTHILQSLEQIICKQKRVKESDSRERRMNQVVVLDNGSVSQ